MDIDAYLDRIGCPRPEVATSDAMRRLHAAHLERVPFENLDIPLGNRIGLDEDALFDKIVTRRRGGFCYELNSLFGALLTALGYRVTLLGAAVFSGTTSGPRLGHVALRVGAVDGSEWLADVGFGAHSRYPLRVEFDVDQHDPDGVFRLVGRPDGDIDVCKDGKIEYRLEPHPRTPADCAAMCWYTQTSPDSHFTRSVVCSRSTPDGRVSLSGDRLIVTRGGTRSETTLPDDDAILAAYRDEFGVQLDRVPRPAAVTTVR